MSPSRASDDHQLNLPGELATLWGPACLPCLCELPRKLLCHALFAHPVRCAPGRLRSPGAARGEGAAITLDPTRTESEPLLVRSQHFPLLGGGDRDTRSLSLDAYLGSSAA